MRIRTGHASLQFSDNDQQHTHDIKKIFKRAGDRRLAWMTGTEAGPGSGNIGEELRRIGSDSGYKLWVPEIQAEGKGQATDCWIAVRKDLIVGDWQTDYTPAIPGSRELYRAEGLDPDLNPRWGPKGLVAVSFQSLPQIGEVSIGAAHYLTKARNPQHAEYHGVDHWEWNEVLAGVIGDWANEAGRGSALVFYGGDQNMGDQKNSAPQGDTFFGEDLTTTWDELRKWDNTGHGTIDVIASYNKDGRVKALTTEAFNDKEFFLHMDHFFVEATFRVDPIKR